MYSNPKNKPEDRIEYLEEVMAAIEKNLTHSGAEPYKQDIPFEQWVGREYKRQKFKEN